MLAPATTIATTAASIATPSQRDADAVQAAERGPARVVGGERFQRPADLGAQTLDAWADDELRDGARAEHHDSRDLARAERPLPSRAMICSADQRRRQRPCPRRR